MTPCLTQPHHDGSACYTAPGPRGLGAVVALRVFVPDLPDGRAGAEHVVLRTVRDGEPELTHAAAGTRVGGGQWWHVDITLVNRVSSYRFFLGGPDGSYRWLNATGVHERDTSDGSDFLINAEDQPPSWVLDQVAYQIFPDRFARSAPTSEPGAASTGARRELPEWAEPMEWDAAVPNAGKFVSHLVAGGDLDGIAAHLDHLVELGCTVLYLTPVFEGRSNHRYDAVSFDRVDPLLGGDEALERLIQACHARGIRVLGDLTTNHTGDGHEWFLAALADADAPERSFYRFRSFPDDYVCWFGVRSLPKLDHASPELRRRLYEGPDSIVARWIRAGLDGWRIDVANMTGRMGADDLAHDVARRIRATMHAVNPEAWLLAEHGHDASGDLLGDGWDGTMDYQGFTRPLWVWLNAGFPGAAAATTQDRGDACLADELPAPLEHGLDFLGLPTDIPLLGARSAVATMREVHARMPWAAQTASTLHLDSHDVPRLRTVTGGGTDGWIDTAGHGRPGHLVALGVQMTMPGVPSVFAGDEIGLTGLNGEHARTPFPWDTAEWDSPTWDAYRFWVALRREHVALRRGGLRWADVGEESFTFVREHPDERLLVHVRRPTPPGHVAADREVHLPLALVGGAVGEVLAGEAFDVVGKHAVMPTSAGVHVWRMSSGDLAWDTRYGETE